MKKKFLTVLSLFIPFFSAMSVDTDAMFPNLAIGKYHYEKTKAEIAKTGTGRLKMCYIYNIRNSANSARNSTPNPISSLKNNPDNVNVTTEMELIYKLCVAYLFDEDPAYLNKAVEHLTAWADGNTAVGKYNIHESAYNKGIEGYSIIRNVISVAERTQIDNWIRRRTNVFVADNDLRSNNWGTCLMYQMYMAGLAINEQTYIDWFKNRYPAWVKGNLFPNGTTTDLLGRDAFAYHAYDLSFFGDIFHAMAIYEGYPAADEFYSRDVNWGASIKKSAHFWMPFMLDTRKYTHVEFTNTEWEPDWNRSDANKPFNPTGHLYAFDKLFEMDYSLKPVIDVLRGGNVYATWALALGGMRWEFGDHAEE